MVLVSIVHLRGEGKEGGGGGGGRGGEGEKRRRGEEMGREG